MKLYYDPKGRPEEPPVSLDKDDTFTLQTHEFPQDSFAGVDESVNIPVATEPISTQESLNNMDNIVDLNADSNGNTTQMSPEKSDPSEIYVIEKILNTRYTKGQKQYLVKWAGYSNNLPSHV